MLLFYFALYPQFGINYASRRLGENVLRAWPNLGEVMLENKSEDFSSTLTMMSPYDDQDFCDGQRVRSA